MSKQREQTRLKALSEAKADREKEDGSRKSEYKKNKIRAEMRESWSEQKDRKNRKEERRISKDRRKAAEWALKDKEEIGPVEAFKRKRGGQAGQAGDGDETQGFDVEYKALKKQVKEERASKKGKKEISTSVGMFEGLD